jgi:hypothetical protein
MECTETEHEVIDNFLPSDVFAELQTLLLPSESIENSKEQILWYYTPNKTDWKLFQLTHMVYKNTREGLITSPLYEKIIPHYRKSLDIKELIRIKINMYPNTQNVQEHRIHIDWTWTHKAAIFSINTCDGYTKLEDGTKIDSVANRMLIFNGSTFHCSTTTTNQSVRMNINFNYF